MFYTFTGVSTPSGSTHIWIEVHFHNSPHTFKNNIATIIPP